LSTPRRRPTSSQGIVTPVESASVHPSRIAFLTTGLVRMTCHKAMRTDVFRSLDLSSRGFDIEPEITGKLLAGGYQIYEVPIRYQARGRAEGKKLTAMDGVRVIRKLVECRLAAGMRFPDRRRKHA
jgi:hypothetical protein